MFGTSACAVSLAKETTVKKKNKTEILTHRCARVVIIQAPGKRSWGSAQTCMCTRTRKEKALHMRTQLLLPKC